MISGVKNPLVSERAMQALREIRRDHREIRACIFSDPDFPEEVEKILNRKPFSEEPYTGSGLAFLQNNHPFYVSPFVKGSPGQFQLWVYNKPFYIKGIAYNTGHDWRDGNIPLTRRQLKKDLIAIRAMGANTIRRYGKTFYDRNIIALAEECDLKVMYGFYFDPKVDYFKDTVRVLHYLKEVEQTVLRYKNHTSVLGWSIGNETWGLLKKKFSKPYLTKVRAQYVKMIERMAERIHELDPDHPVFTCMEDARIQLPGELAAFREQAPSIDVIGVNSYYRENIERLNTMFTRFNPERPYLVSEFGPLGYWDDYENKLPDGSLLEQSDPEKAAWYATQWKKYIVPNAGKNIGGVAYCWRDRMEGSLTWFGLTDYRGRIKPSCVSLQEAWGDAETKDMRNPLPSFSIAAPPLIVPGKEQTFSCKTTKKSKHKLHYEWKLFKDEYLKPVNSIRYREGDSSVQVELPDEHGSYRLYLFVSDEKGNVTTSSLSFRL